MRSVRCSRTWQPAAYEVRGLHNQKPPPGTLAMLVFVNVWSAACRRRKVRVANKICAYVYGLVGVFSASGAGWQYRNDRSQTGTLWAKAAPIDFSLDLLRRKRPMGMVSINESYMTLLQDYSETRWRFNALCFLTRRRTV
jgi:hypothetical protein